VTYEDWETSVPATIRNDSLWRMEAYRVGLFLCDLAWRDCTQLLKDRRAKTIADQLFRATGNISSNFAEGYSRGSGKDRARFYEYALGSAREARDWYFKSRFILSANVIEHRLGIIEQVIRLGLRMVNNERRTNRSVTRLETPSPI